MDGGRIPWNYFDVKSTVLRPKDLVSNGFYAQSALHENNCTTEKPENQEFGDCSKTGKKVVKWMGGG
jgi:hypothetical protein